MDLQTAIDDKQSQIENASQHPAVKHLNRLTHELGVLLEAQAMLVEATVKAEKATAKGHKAKSARRGSLAFTAIEALEVGHAFGMTLDELHAKVGRDAPQYVVKEALERHIGGLLLYDFVSGLYSLKSREGERQMPLEMPVARDVGATVVAAGVFNADQRPEAVAAFLNSIPQAD